MTRDEIINMAREADIDPHDMCEDPRIAVHNLERFAALVAAAEREACAVAATELRKLHAENEALRSVNKELAVIVKELCACYSHPLPEATIAREGEVK